MRGQPYSGLRRVVYNDESRSLETSENPLITMPKSTVKQGRGYWLMR